MIKIKCSKHGESPSVLTDSILLRRECQYCLEDDEHIASQEARDLDSFHYRDEFFNTED